MKTKPHFAPYPLDPAAWQIADALRAAVRASGRPASTRAVAMRVGWSERTTRERLAKLEACGLVWRPAGAKSGWTPRAGVVQLRLL